MLAQVVDAKEQNGGSAFVSDLAGRSTKWNSIAHATPLRCRPRQRFTLDGDKGLERYLESVCAEISSEVGALIPKSKLGGLLLAGGYGRGEGGVLRSDAGDQPYNDLEFYVFIRGNRVLAECQYRAALQKLGVRLSARAGLEVEFKVLTLDTLRRAAPSMFSYDLLLGHRWLIGEDSWLSGCEHHGDAAKIPLHEATRLLMNRCSGLLFGTERLRRRDFGVEDADFVGRNLAKAQLAFGDVLLAASGQYHWSCRERHARLQALEGFADQDLLAAIRRHHGVGVDFKLHPVRSTDTCETFSHRHAELSHLGRRLWLWLENLRLGTSFRSPREYALSARNKCAEQPALRNRLVSAREFGLVGLRCGRYPRERLLNTLGLLLWEDDVLSDSALLGRVQEQLRTGARNFASLVAAYERLWHRFN